MKKLAIFLSLVLMFITTTAFSSFAKEVTKEKDQKVIEITTEEGEQIGIGKAEVISLKKYNGPVKVTQEEIEDGTLNSVKQNITIDSVYSDTKIEIPLELNNGEYIELYQDEEGKVYSSGNIYNKENESIGIITTTLKENKENIDVDAQITENDTLQLTLDPKTVNQPVQMEIVVTSGSTFSTYFSSGSWITRDGVKSLSLTHKAYLTSAEDVGVAGVKKTDSWNKVKAKFSSSSNWYNAGGLKDQYDCHFDFAKNKNPWNLEPSRPDVSYFETVLKACNP